MLLVAPLSGLVWNQVWNLLKWPNRKPNGSVWARIWPNRTVLIGLVWFQTEFESVWNQTSPTLLCTRSKKLRISYWVAVGLTKRVAFAMLALEMKNIHCQPNIFEHWIIFHHLHKCAIVVEVEDVIRHYAWQMVNPHCGQKPLNATGKYVRNTKANK